MRNLSSVYLLPCRYNDNQRAQDAMNLTMFHWGFHAWVASAIIGLLLAYVGHRYGRPMTIRSCFYPLLGDVVYGLLGDLIDTLSLVGLMFSMCTTLVFGAISFNRTLHYLNGNIADDDQTTRIFVIWATIVVATISVMLGLKLAVRRLSKICFGIGTLLMLFVFLRGNTWYFLNVYVQGVGYYLQYAIQLSFHTEAYAQEGNAPDGKENPRWMEEWTLFYWSWWISWSPYVGMFIAKISRGRTIRNYLMWTVIAPVCYTFLWISIFGGAGLAMEREATLAGIKCSSELGGSIANKSHQGIFRLSCRYSSQMLFDLMQSYNENFASYLAFVSVSLYLVTTFVGGFLVINCIAANGSYDAPVIQRVFCGVTAGACATGLLVSSKYEAVNALQTATLNIAAPIHAIIVCVTCFALWKVITSPWRTSTFQKGLFDGILLPLSSQRMLRLFVAVVLPWFPAGSASAKLSGRKTYVPMITGAVLCYTSIILELFGVVDSDTRYIGWIAQFGYFVFVTSIRTEVRKAYKIDGNILQDFLVVTLLHPFAVLQMEAQVLYQYEENDVIENAADVDNVQNNAPEIRERETLL